MEEVGQAEERERAAASFSEEDADSGVIFGESESDEDLLLS